ncbi:hypothetical protein ERE_34300 [Agathobacter rectalis M104/1]|uniref:TerD family protein n=1 Tax=Agathobacter rectalis TaxID=39491 RepID=UPI0001CD0F5F|nr:TerD family protein [Agathobacter rectalis]CBK95175.1 hypothetical protein ERE_34300 [Agathobacter rectalis M104/1]
MENSVFSIILRRKNRVFINDNDMLKSLSGAAGEKNKQIVATMNKNIEVFGYTMSEALFDKLVHMKAKSREVVYDILVNGLKEITGADKVYNPMYPNFPESVMKKDDFELYFNAIVHYWSFGTLLPYEEKEERAPLFNTAKVKVLEAGSFNDLNDIFNNLCASKTSLSKNDVDDMIFILNSVKVTLPDEIPFKENAACVCRLLVDTGVDTDGSLCKKYVKTATDILRLITAMSDGDVSLAENTKFRNLKRSERRIIMNLLAGCGNAAEDMNRYAGRWIRVGEKLHPGEFAKNERYTKVVQAFGVIRNDGKIQSFAGKVDAAVASGDVNAVVSLLKKRPGEFARRIDFLLRTFDKDADRKTVIMGFASVAKDVSSTVLLQVREHFINKLNGNDDMRVFFPKGNLARSYYVKNNKTETVSEDAMKMVIAVCESALVNIYGNREFLGKVYIDEALKNYTVPFSLRSAGKTMTAVSRGSRIAIDDSAKIIRPFIWWTNTKDNIIDVDLSIAVFADDWNCLEHVSYSNLKSSRFGICHSGDITNGGPVDGEGVAEFIDLDIEKALSAGARYAVFNVYNFSNENFSKMEHAAFGFMTRNDIKIGEIFEPSTVKQRMDLASATTTCIPVIFDLKERVFVWCDMALTADHVRAGYGGINVESNLPSVVVTCKAIVDVKKPNLYDLFTFNATARGVITDNPDEADIRFGLDDNCDVKPSDIDVIVGKYL